MLQTRPCSELFHASKRSIYVDGRFFVEFAHSHYSISLLIFTCSSDDLCNMSDSERKALVLMDGWAVKRGRVVKSWRRRYFVLNGNLVLSYYTDQKVIPFTTPENSAV